MKQKLLSSLESMILLAKRKNNLPPVFVVGCPRSGTTIISQYLLAKYKFAYFSNLDRANANFPIVSAIWNQSAKKFQPEFRNQYGQIKGIHAPGDGWEIFHRWFSYYYHPIKNNSSIHQLKTTIAYYESIYGWPFFVKNNANSLRIIELSTLFPNAIIVVIQRNIYENINSIIKGKKKNQIPDDQFWGTGPDNALIPDIPKDPVANSVYQYLFINKFITSSIKKISHKKVLTINFSEFKKNPSAFLEKFAGCYDQPLVPRHQKESEVHHEQQKIMDNPSQITTNLKIQIHQYVSKYESELDYLIEYLLTTHGARKVPSKT